MRLATDPCDGGLDGFRLTEVGTHRVVRLVRRGRERRPCRVEPLRIAREQGDAGAQQRKLLGARKADALR